MTTECTGFGRFCLPMWIAPCRKEYQRYSARLVRRQDGWEAWTKQTFCSSQVVWGLLRPRPLLVEARPDFFCSTYPSRLMKVAQGSERSCQRPVAWHTSLRRANFSHHHGQTLLAPRLAHQMLTHFWLSKMLKMTGRCHLHQFERHQPLLTTVLHCAMLHLSEGHFTRAGKVDRTSNWQKAKSPTLSTIVDQHLAHQ